MTAPDAGARVTTFQRGRASPRRESATVQGCAWSGRQTGGLTSFLAGLSILSLAGEGFAVNVKGSTVQISYLCLVSPLLIGNVLIALIVGRLTLLTADRKILGLSLFVSGCLAVPLVKGASLLQVWGFLTLATGTLTGVIVAIVWNRSTDRLNLVDVGCAGFIVLTCAQLLGRLNGAVSVSDFHRDGSVSWGGSNYVAGVLVVASLVLLGRLRFLNAPVVTFLVPIAGVLGAVVTLSRGSAVAASVGIGVFLLSKGRGARTSSPMRIARLLLIAVPFAAVRVVQTILEYRSVGGYNPLANNRTRLELYGIAWRQFSSSPFFGTGWYGMRDFRVAGTNISFAHNFVLSFLQIGGIFGGLAVLVVVFVSVTAIICRTPFSAAVASALVVASLDPFLEGVQGSLVTWMALSLAWFAIPKQVAAYEAATGASLFQKDGAQSADPTPPSKHFVAPRVR